MKATRKFGAVVSFVVVLAAQASVSRADSLPFTTGLKLWLDATQGVATSGSTVTGWADQSGNGHDGSYTSGAPQLVPGAINALPAIGFNGAGDYFSLAGGAVLSSDSFTVFAVATDTSDSDSGPREIYSNWDAGNSWSSVFLGTSDGSDFARSARFTDGFSASEALNTPGSPFVVWGVYSGGVSAEMFVDNASLGSAAQNNSPADIGNPNGQRDVSTPSFIGQQGSFSGEYWQGLIGEVLVYEGALTADQQAEVYDYLYDKWFVVPEPSGCLLMTLALVGAFYARWRRRRVPRVA
ncbi:MAG: hypothetical protein AB7U73_04565 [Pirellulales bacterium]